MSVFDGKMSTSNVCENILEFSEELKGFSFLLFWFYYL